MRSPLILGLVLLLGCATTQSQPSTTTNRPPTVGCRAMGWVPVSTLLPMARDSVRRMVDIWQNFALRSCMNFHGRPHMHVNVTQDLGEVCRYGQLECFLACHGLDPSVRHLYGERCQQHWEINLNLN